MRLRHLNLEFFGGFTGKKFDFGPRRDESAADFHVIYGPNEAGKTTTMEAYLRLLYGFRPQEPYDFLHQRKNLRVSGLLDIDGTETAFTRLPTRAPTLRDANGQKLPNSVLRAHLGGLSETDYRNLFCLDDLTIEKGGEEITRAKGDIGRLLFSAAAGISELSKVLDGVRAEADSLYRTRASTTQLAILKKDYAEIEDQIRELDVSASQYRDLKKRLDDAMLEEAQTRDRRQELRTSKAQLDAKIEALPKLSEIGELDKSLVDFESWPERLDVEPEELLNMLLEQNKAQNDVTKLNDELAGLHSDLSAIEYHPAHVGLTQELKALDNLRSRYKTADRDLERHREELEQVLEDMGLAITELGAPAGLNPKHLVLSSAALSKLEQTRERMRDAEVAVKRERDEVAAIDEEIEKAKERLSSLEAGTSINVDLANIFEYFDIDTLSARHAAASEAIKLAHSQRRAAFDELKIKGQSFEALPSCPLTLEEAEILLGELQEISRRHKASVQNMENTRAEIAERSARIAQIKEIDGFIDDVELRDIRKGRDQLWMSHRANPTNQTADAFESAMTRVDSTMDLRLSQTADLGTLRQQEQDLAAAKARMNTVEKEMTALDQERSDVLVRLAAAATKASIRNPIAPTAFVNWLRKLDLAGQADSNLTRLRDEHRETFEKADRLVKVLADHVHRDVPEFSELVAVIKTELKAQTSHQKNLQIAQKGIDNLTTKRASRIEKLSDIRESAESARNEWEALISEALPEKLNVSLLETSLQPLQDLRQHEKRRVELERQTASMENDQIQFAEEVQMLAKRVNVAATTSPLDDFDALAALAKQAVDAGDQQRKLKEQIQTHEKSLADAKRVLENIDLAVETHSQMFPDGVDTSSLDALRTAVKTGVDVIAKRARRTELERSLTSLLNLNSVADAREILTDTTLARLRAEIDEVNADLEDIEVRWEDAFKERTSAEQALRDIGGDSDVARLVESKTTLELEMQHTALRNLELSLGHRLAEIAIRRYRDSHRSGMMQAAEAAFVALTNGAYSKLQTQIDGDSEALLALDAAGIAKQAQDMSKGTRFQLYLALRAAAYDQLADQGISLPFFCDDIFETFDEERTRSACRVMTEIGRRGQAIYLTHHKHVVNIAHEVCGAGVQIHNIEP